MSFPRRTLLTASLLCTGCLAFTAITACAAGLKSSKDRKNAPAFTLKDRDGRAVQLSDYKGKVVLLNFFATWCGPCKVEIPWFVEFEQTYKSKGFAVLGVSMDEDGWDVLKPFLAQKKVNYRVVLGNDSVGQLYGGVDSLPTTFIVDRDGKVAAVHIGLVSKSDYQNELNTLLETGGARAANAAPGIPAIALPRAR